MVHFNQEEVAVAKEKFVVALKLPGEQGVRQGQIFGKFREHHFADRALPSIARARKRSLGDIAIFLKGRIVSHKPQNQSM